MPNQKKHLQDQIQPASDLTTFQLMFESHPAIMLLIEPDTGLIMEANPAAIKFYGYPKLELCGLPIDALITYPLELIARKHNKASDEDLDGTVFLHRLASGEVRNVEVLSSPLVSQGKQLQFWIVNDITERKQAEEALLNLQIYRASDLFIKNEEIALQNEGNEKRAFELEIANQELVFQNEEKAKRAAELFFAKELGIHNEEKFKQAEEKLRKSELRYRTQFDQASDGIIQMSIEGEVINLNLSFARMHGYSVKEMLGMNLRDLDPSESPQIFNERIRRILAGEKIEFEVEHYHKDGHLFPLSVSTGLISMGTDLNFQAIYRDITERKQLEQVVQSTFLDLQKSLEQRDIALEELNNNRFELEMQNEELRESQAVINLTRARYFDLYDHAPVGYCTISKKGLILEANLTAANLLGVNKADMIKYPFSIFITRQNQDIYYLHIRKALETGMPQSFKLQMQKFDKSTFWARLETTEAQDTNADQMLLVVISEINKLKTLEIRNSERLKELTCINDISRLAFTSELTEQQICDEIIERLIPAMGHPTIAAAAIILNGKQYQSPFYSKQINTRLTADILQNGQKCGNITVCYTQAASFYLPEEQNLLDNIADVIGLWNERQISERDVKKLTQAIEQSPLSILITKPDGSIEYANSHFCSLTGYSLSEVVGKNPRILQSDFTTKEDYKLLWDTILSGQIWEGKFLNRKKDGTLFWEKATIAPMFDEMGRIIHFLAIKENITAHKIMENELLQSETHNRGLLNAIPDMKFRIRRDGIILDCRANPNDRLLEHPETLIGLSIFDNLDESVASEVRAIIKLALLSSGVQTSHLEIKLKDGIHIFEARTSRISKEEVVAIVRDISEQSRLEQMKTDFLNRASHELRTPIATMLLMVDLLDEKMKAEKSDEYWDVLKSELQRERGLIEHLLSAGFLEGEQEHINYRSLEIDVLILQAVQHFEPEARKKGVSLNAASIPADDTSPRLVEGDQNDLNLVLINLIGNAIKFTPSGGKVSVQTQSVDGNLLISIIDSGIGIPSKDLPLLFSRFFRGSNAIDEEIQGTGLGLFIVRSILEKHHGRIEVTSEQGNGSRFDVWLPIIK